MFKIFQYETQGRITKWVAAKTPQAANKCAESKGWRHCGGQIFREKADIPQTRPELRAFGCDVIVEDLS